MDQDKKHLPDRPRNLQERIDQGLAEAAHGEGVEGELFLKGLLDDLDAREAKRKAG